MQHSRTCDLISLATAVEANANPTQCLGITKLPSIRPESVGQVHPSTILHRSLNTRLTLANKRDILTDRTDSASYAAMVIDVQDTVSNR